MLTSSIRLAGDVHAGADEPYLFGGLRVGGADPSRSSYRSFASFRDPDGNGRVIVAEQSGAKLPS